MELKEAKTVRLPFGKHKGETIDDVACKDDGLRYLDWMHGLDNIRDERFREALECYFDDPDIAKEIEDALK